MTIDKIYSDGNISVRSYHACKYNKIETIVDLKSYYSKHKTFTKLRNCGEKSSLELIKLCKSSNENITEILSNSQIESIDNYIKLSIGSLSVTSLSAINNFFNNDLDIKTFLKTEIFSDKLDLNQVFNFKESKSNELIDFFYRIKMFYENHLKLKTNNRSKEENTLIKTIKKLNRLQRQVINQFIKITTSNLKVRSRNAITSYIGESLRLNSFSINIFGRDDFQISKIKNIGKRYIPELELYLDKIKAFINEVSIIINEDELVSLNNNYLIQNVYSIDNIPNKILQSQSIIKLCEFLILENAFFKTDYNTIFINTINVFNSNCKTLDETALLTNLTRERVRQIRQRCFLEIPDKIEFLKNFEDDLYQNYEIEINNEFIIISDEKVNEINFIYDTHFSKNFLSYIISIYLSEQFNLIGNIEDVLIPRQSNARNRHNWKNLFLVKKDVQEKIDLNKLCEDISVRLQEKINETYSFNFKSYLSRFLIEDNFRILEIIKDDCETIIFEEFNLFLDLDENIVFERTTFKQLPEYISEILEEFGKPTTIEDIYIKLEHKYPNVTRSAEALRGSCQRADNLIYFGRSSTYGLKKWETEKENIKGGTIKDIIIDFLQDKKEPVHIIVVLEHLNKFRENKDSRSVITNLKVDPMKRFILYKQGFIGLKRNKEKYNNEKYENLPVQLGKTIIAKHKKGYSIEDIKYYLKEEFDLSFEESKLLLDNLKYFNENTRN